MFQTIARKRAPLCGCWPGAFLGLLACAGTQAGRHDELRAELRRAAPPSANAGAGSRAPASELSVQGRLTRAALVRAVLENNPNIEAARQGWRAALAQYSQRGALPDPMLEYSFAPLSIASNDVSYGHSITLSQRFPWPGKLSLAQEVALAEAEAAQDDYQSTRLELALMASLLFDQYYAVARSLELNAQHRQLVDEIKRAAEAQYETGRGSQQDPIQAEMELGYVERQKIELNARRASIIAQLNGLMHRPPQAPLPPPPEELDLPALEVSGSAELQKEALANRPELSARRAELRAREKGRELAERDYYPDFGVMASYSSMWAMPEHQWMLGVSVDLPLQRANRKGAVEESEARIQQVQALLRGQRSEIRAEVEQARQEVLEAGQVLVLYRERLLPAARAQIEAARASYVTGNGSFQSLIDAERSLRNVELEYQQALAALGQKRARLVRTLGQLPLLAGAEVTP